MYNVSLAKIKISFQNSFCIEKLIWPRKFLEKFENMMSQLKLGIYSKLYLHIQYSNKLMIQKDFFQFFKHIRST